MLFNCIKAATHEVVDGVKTGFQSHENSPGLTPGLPNQNIISHAQNQSNFLRTRINVIVKVNLIKL